MYEIICECGSNEFIAEPKGCTFSFDDINEIKSFYICNDCNKRVIKIKFIYEYK
jgi:hypothetical protein